MAQKTATYYGYGEEDQCAEVCKLIEDAGIHLHRRDMAKFPLSARELDGLLGHNPLTYFINPAAKEYEKLGLDKKRPERAEMLEILAENPELLRRPIIKSSRLVTVGCNKEKISEMLQISRNGSQIDEPNGNRGGRITRRSLPSKK
jgi:regulatory protein spx